MNQSLRLSVLFLFTSLVLGNIIDDEILPNYKIEVFKPKGLKISVPHTDGMTLFAVHVNVNKEMFHLEAGQIAVDVVKRRGDFWVYQNDDIRLRPGDKLYFWLYVIYDKLGYRLDNQEYTVPGQIPPKVPTPSKTPSPTPTPNVETPTKVDKPVQCQISETMVSGKTVCKNEIVFFEQFDNNGGWNLGDKWTSEIELPGPESKETYFVVLDANNVGIESGSLSIKPSLLEQKYSTNFVRSGHLKLNGCTASTRGQCEVRGSFWNIVPPVISSRINTKNSFTFKYGKVAVRAKLPKGDWIVPEIWLVGKNYGPHSGRITIAKSNGNEDLKATDQNIGGQFLEQGISIGDGSPTMFGKNRNSQWSDDFHVYQIEWAPGYIKFKVDDNDVGNIAPDGKLFKHIIGGSNLAPFDTEFYLSFGVHVGGLVDFPDECLNRGSVKPWMDTDVKNVLKFWLSKDKWYPTWGDHSKLLIDYVKVTAL